jgi:hypothetical protein
MFRQDSGEFSPDVNSPSSDDQSIGPMLTNGNDQVTTRVLNIDSVLEVDAKET